MKRQRMYQKNPRPQPRAHSAMESVCDCPQNCIRRAISEIQVRFDYAGYLAEKRNRGTRVSQGRGQSRNGRYQVAVLAPRETLKCILPGRTTSLWS